MICGIRSSKEGRTSHIIKLFHVIHTLKSHNLSTRCVRNRLVASLSTSCNNAVILSSCYISKNLTSLPTSRQQVVFALLVPSC